MPDIRLFKARLWFESRIPDARQRRAVLVAAPVMLACAAWIALYLAFSGAGTPGRVRLTPEIRHAQDLTSKLHQDPAFAGVTVLPHIDNPDRLRVSGGVATPADAEALRARLVELDPAQTYVIEVRAGNRRP